MVEEATENSDLEDVVDNSEIRAHLVDDFLVSTEGQTTGVRLMFRLFSLNACTKLWLYHICRYIG